jgi:hypothetical protein
MAIIEKSHRTYVSYLSPERILGASDRAQLLIEEAQVVLHKADQPDSVADLFDADVSASEHGAEVDLSLPDAEVSVDLHELLRTDSSCCAMIVAPHSAQSLAGVSLGREVHPCRRRGLAANGFQVLNDFAPAVIMVPNTSAIAYPKRRSSIAGQLCHP